MISRFRLEQLKEICLVDLQLGNHSIMVFLKSREVERGTCIRSDHCYGSKKRFANAARWIFGAEEQEIHSIRPNLS